VVAEGLICNCSEGWRGQMPPCPAHSLTVCPRCDGLGYVLNFAGADRAAIYEPCLCQPRVRESQA
jgi:hypothetical protein